eukprot:8074945-Karenia_brevis.AAC.1
MFCATLAGDGAACHQLKQVREQNEASLSESNAARHNLARLFGACFCRGSAEGFVNPVLDKLHCLTEFRSEPASVATIPG